MTKRGRFFFSVYKKPFGILSRDFSREQIRDLAPRPSNENCIRNFNMAHIIPQPWNAPSVVRYYFETRLRPFPLSLSLSLYRTPGSSLCPKERMYVSTRESLSRFCGIKSSLRKTLGGFSSNKRSKSNERIKLSLATGDTGVCLHASPCSRCVRFKCITVKFARQRIPRVVLAGYSFFLSVTLLRRRRGVLLFEERTGNLD